MGKHAYCIMCHNNFEVLKKLVSALDDPRNDIYIHVDRKVKSFSEIKKMLNVCYATLTYTERVSVSWAGFSQIQAELILLEAATKKQHDYYHLLSGADFPLKTQNEIHDFFKNHQGKEFIDFDPDRKDEVLETRVRYYHFFQDRIGRRTDRIGTVLRKIEKLSLQMQHRFMIDRRIKHPHKLRKGSNWFSITHGLAAYILKRKEEIAEAYRFGLGVDEVFLQTFAMESPFAENMAGSAVRHIDWKRGSPYTFQMKDYEELMSSGNMFARKFNEKVDMEIVDRIYKDIRTIR